MNSKRFMMGSTVILIVLLVLLLVKVPVTQVSFKGGSFFLKEGKFELGWIHSVEKEPWFETYERRDESLFLVNTRFKTFGAGTPSTGEVIPSKDGFIHMKINQKMENLQLSVSENVQTTLYLEGRTIPLYTYVEDYETVEIKAIKLPLWQYLRGDKK
ncbi:DUF1850 domain-containing protein [Bacillus tianshenii]|uniref:DUF1850 domain-containing protein n=1 Tax=Sutcliffiella tianshenii TaxID=1463404 RepID=UPI001CD3F30E|nr:DUF1850 domain-containing protein [Bacillus tianshenii]MCA1321540.1 DUF1850 domain-containing protein [Bacillus tianshenii]